MNEFNYPTEVNAPQLSPPPSNEPSIVDEDAGGAEWKVEERTRFKIRDQIPGI